MTLAFCEKQLKETNKFTNLFILERFYNPAEKQRIC